jgi:addiction module RelE/StbE family toxin
MRKLVWDSSFRRAFKKRVRNDRALQARTFEALALLAEEPFHPSLRTHKLKGALEGLWACWVEYDCRIIFLFAPDPEGGEDVIVLVDIGSHDEVY